MDSVVLARKQFVLLMPRNKYVAVPPRKRFSPGCSRKVILQCCQRETPLSDDPERILQCCQERIFSLMLHDHDPVVLPKRGSFLSSSRERSCFAKEGILSFELQREDRVQHCQRTSFVSRTPGRGPCIAKERISSFELPTKDLVLPKKGSSLSRSRERIL